MARITGKMLRARLVQQLKTPSPLHHSESGADYSSVALISIPTDDAFVTEAYRRILLREPDLDGMQHFLAGLKAHRQMIVDSLTNSEENSNSTEPMPESAQTEEGVAEAIPQVIDLTDLDRFEAEDVFVRESYRRILGRDADARGLGHWWTLLLFGAPKVQVLATLAGSNEARARNLDFLWKGQDIQTANEEASKPDASAGEQTRANFQANDDVPKETLRTVDLTDLDQFESEEAFVRESYRRILGREAEPDGLGNYWSLLLFGVRKVQVLAMIASSDEAAARNIDFLWHGQNIESAATEGMPRVRAGVVDLTGLDRLDSEDSFLREGYRRIFGREADPEGLAHFRTVLTSGVSKVQILALLAGSIEAQARNLDFLWQGQSIQAAAEQSTELATYADRQDPAGARKVEVVPEDRPGFVDLTELDQFETEDAFVRETNRRITGRDGDAEELKYHRELLICGVPKVQVLARLARSPEAKARSLHFLWHGAELPAPVRLGLRTRMRLLYRRSTGQSRFEDALSSLSSQLQAALERDNALREDIHLFSTRTLAAQAELTAKCDAIRSETIRAQDRLTSKWRGVAGDIEKLRDQILKTTAAMLAGHASVQNTCENIASETMRQQDRWTSKWDEISGNFEKLRNQAMGTTAAVLAAHANVENKCDAILSETMKQDGQWTGKWNEIAAKLNTLATRP